MYTEKPWWQSLTMWAGIVALLYGTAGHFGYQIGVDQSVIVDMIMQVVGIVVMYGRNRAVAVIAPIIPPSG